MILHSWTSYSFAGIKQSFYSKIKTYILFTLMNIFEPRSRFYTKILVLYLDFWLLLGLFYSGYNTV